MYEWRQMPRQRERSRRRRCSASPTPGEQTFCSFAHTSTYLSLRRIRVKTVDGGLKAALARMKRRRSIYCLRCQFGVMFRVDTQDQLYLPTRHYIANKNCRLGHVCDINRQDGVSSRQTCLSRIPPEISVSLVLPLVGRCHSLDGSCRTSWLSDRRHI